MSFSLTLQRYCTFRCVCVPGDFYFLLVSDPTCSLSKNSSHIQFDDAKIRTLLLCLRAGRIFYSLSLRPAVSQRTPSFSLTLQRYGLLSCSRSLGDFLSPFVRRAWLAPLQHPCHSFDATKIALLFEPRPGHLILQRSRRDSPGSRTHVRTYAHYIIKDRAHAHRPPAAAVSRLPGIFAVSKLKLWTRTKTRRP